jgi:hypothetical protein
MAETWTTSETAFLKHLVHQGWGPERIHQEFTKEGIAKTHQSIRRKIQNERKRAPHEWHAHIAAPPDCAKRFDQQVKVEAERALLLFDIHAPFHDADWLNRLIGLGLKRKVELVGIGGDLVDFSAFSKFGRQERVEAEDEIEAAAQIVSTLAGEFKRVIYSGGNHEMRLPRKTDNLLELRDAMGMFVRAPNVTVTDYHWFELLSGGREWYIEHPKNASVNSGVVPAKLCAKYHKNVAAGHGHRWGITMDVSGTWYGVDVGVCADPPRMAYITKVHSTRPAVCQGALLVEGGIPLLLSPDNIVAYGG